MAGLVGEHGLDAHRVAQHPGRQIHRVCAKVHHRAAAGGLRVIPIVGQPAGQRAVVAVAAAQHGDIADHAGLNRLLDEQEFGPCALRQGDGEDHMVLFHGLDDFVAVLDVQTHDFFGVDVLACLGGLDHDILVHVGGGVDADGVHVVPRQQLVQIGFKGRAQLLRPGLTALGDLIPDAGQLHIVHLGQAARILQRVNMPFAQHCNFQHNHRLLCLILFTGLTLLLSGIFCLLSTKNGRKPIQSFYRASGLGALPAKARKL